MSRDIRHSIHLAWGILSVALLICCLLLFTASDEVVMKVSRFLRSEHPNEESCGMCGMTRGFVAIAKGNLSESWMFNPYALPLFLVILINETVFISYGIKNRLNILNKKDKILCKSSA